MEIFKPLKLAIMQRAFEHHQQAYLCLGAMGMFTFSDPTKLRMEIDLWKFAAETLGEEAIFDEGFSKPAGELLVAGSCFPPGGEATASYVEVELGAIKKRLVVQGNRYFRGSRPSQPVPFKEMPVVWERALGGQGYPLNPKGKGIDEIPIGDALDAADSDSDLVVQPLPNIEHPKLVMASPSDRHEPQGLRAYGLMWQQRQVHTGTYDEKWMETEFPGLAPDTDYRLFHMAPSDQRIKGYWSGGEAFRISNMHPDKPILEGTLPSLRARFFVQRGKRQAKYGEDGRILASELGPLTEVDTRLETVWLFPKEEVGFIICRGMVKIQESDAMDIKILLGAWEQLGEEKTLEHYRSAVELRRDPQMGGLYVLRDGDLMPSNDGKSPAFEMEAAKFATKEGFRKDAVYQGKLRDYEKRKAELEAQGVNPDTYLPKPASINQDIDLTDIDGLVVMAKEAVARAEEEKAKAVKEQLKREKQLQELYEQQGRDFKGEMQERMEEGGGPPDFTAKKEVERLTMLCQASRTAGSPMLDVEAMLQDPEYLQSLRKQEAMLRESYVQRAHLNLPARAATPTKGKRVQQRLIRGYKNGEELAEHDVTGVDLSGLQLPQAKLANAFMESSCLDGCDLRQADLRGAVLAHALLTGTDLSGAVMSNSNLGRARLYRANLQKADLSEAILHHTSLIECDMTECNLTRATVSKATLVKTTLRGVVLTDCSIKDMNLDGLDFAGTCLDGVSFHNCTLRGARFSAANLKDTTFSKCNLDGADFSHTNWHLCCISYMSSAEGLLLRQARVFRSTFQDLPMKNSCFDEANLLESQLSGVDASYSSFYRTVMKECSGESMNLTGSKLRGANLMYTALDRSILYGADFTGANLFQANLALTHLDRQTKMQNVLSLRMGVLPRRKQDAADA